jgi:hypothetical protein
MFYYKLYNKQIALPLILFMYPTLVPLIGDKVLCGGDLGLEEEGGEGEEVDPADYGFNFSLSIFHNDYK